MVDTSSFLEKVKEIARNQFKIETARKARIEKLMKENERLREDTDKLKKRIKECEEQRRKRLIMIKELRVLHENAQRGIFVDDTVQKSASEPVQNVAPPAPVVTPDRSQRLFVAKEKDEQLSTKEKRIVADPDIVAQAKANTASRNRVVNPCHFARNGSCRYGVRCRASHNVLPVNYCVTYNTSGVCEIPNCPLLHSLYSYSLGASAGPVSAPAGHLERRDVVGGGGGRFTGNRTPPQDVSGSRWK